MSGITFKEIASASIPTPAATKATVFLNSADSAPSYKNSAGVVTPLKGTTGTSGQPGQPGSDGRDGLDSFVPGPAGQVGATGVAGATGATGAPLIARITAASAAIANTETVVTSATLAANSLVAGSSFSIRAAGVGTTGLTPGVDTFRIRIGPTTLTGTIPTSVAPTANASVTAQAFAFEALVTVRTAGAGGTVIGECRAVGDDIATGLFTMLVDLSATTATVAVDTTVANLIELTFQSATAGSSCTFHVATIESGVPSAAIAGPSVSENFLTGDVTMTNANQFYDGPSLSLAAGTYVLMGVVSLAHSGTPRWFTAKLWDGTTQMGDAPGQYSSTTGGGTAIQVFGQVVLGSTTTVKISAASDDASSTIKATAATNGVTNKASHLLALKIA